jgi:CubicO group peptidase (beta-lactamase class C family)
MKLIHCIAAILCCVFLCGGVGLAQAPGSLDAAAIKSFFESGLKRNGIIGGSLSVLQDGKVVFKDSYGYADLATSQPVDDDTAFHWGSISKTFTGIAIMQLRDRGLLKLDDPLVKYLPELAAIHDPWGPVDAITIRQMMTHTSGFRAPSFPWKDWDKSWQPFEPTHWSQIVAMLPYTEVEFPPGSKFSYSNLGVLFLGQVIERITDEPYEVYLDKNILKPLEMYQSYCSRSPYHLLKHRAHSYILEKGKLTEQRFDFDAGVTAPNGGLNAPLPDMIKYLKFLLLADPSKRDIYEGILKRSSLEEMWRPQFDLPPGYPFPEDTRPDRSIGLSFFIREDNGRQFVGHSGGQIGFISHFYIQPDSGDAYIVAYNTDAYDENQKSNTRKVDHEIRNYIFDSVIKQRSSPPR